MKRIPFKMNESKLEIETFCPYGMKEKESIIKVGSFPCKICRHFKSFKIIDMIVECNWDERI